MKRVLFALLVVLLVGSSCEENEDTSVYENINLEATDKGDQSTGGGKGDN